MEETSEFENSENPEERLLFLVTPPIFIIAIIAGFYQYHSIAIFFGSVLVAFFIYRLNIIQTVFGINIKRWNLWFGIECATGFFYFGHLGLLMEFYIGEFANRYVLLYQVPLVFSMILILYREFYLVPNRLQEYFEKNHVNSGKQKKIKKELRKEELGLLFLSSIIAFGLGNFIDLAVIIASVLFIYKGLKIEIKNRRYKSATEKFFKAYIDQADSYWLNFIGLPMKFMIAFVLITFVCFINMPSFEVGWVSQDVILEPLLIASLITLIIVIKYKKISKKLVQLVSLILSLVIVMSIIVADPAIFPFIRRVTEDLNIGTDVQFFLMFCFILMVCASLFLLNDVNQTKIEPKEKMKNKKDTIRILLYFIIALGLLALLLYAYQRVELVQIKVLLIFCATLIITLPLISKIRQKILC